MCFTAETAYVTGGAVQYGSIWGSYLPIIKKYADNGRLWWLNMQYYNGEMYDCDGGSYPAGTVEGFKYSDAMIEKGKEGLVWNNETLNAYLEDPKAYGPKNKMAFPGLKNPQDRADVIAYLDTGSAK